MGRYQSCKIKENIALLRMLVTEPERPVENPAPHNLAERNYADLRQLSFRRERDLVDDLAFLSASSEDPEKVMAVCVEENPNQMS